ncbi:hypothetical protein [Gimesia chilikensis]|uniref:Uncharacterized protein n=1 Tax=Gimesia chilikensis TaxID=2605989 RepID=A0A517PWR0_9PLAN|nr:hypothetical protein [Gimesia chilikensis]QDT23817.1 hypothetical protein HG66A1_56420 [Gimesia chilikensis]
MFYASLVRYASLQMLCLAGESAVDRDRRLEIRQKRSTEAVSATGSARDLWCAGIAVLRLPELLTELSLERLQQAKEETDVLRLSQFHRY